MRVHTDWDALNGVLDFICEQKVLVIIDHLVSNDLELVLDLKHAVKHKERVAQSLN